MRERWLSPKALLVHVAGLFVVGSCLALGYWQYLRATGGNSLSWAYVFEWPVFAGFAAYLWWDFVHHPHRDEPIDAPPHVLPPGWARAVGRGRTGTLPPSYAGTLGRAAGHDDRPAALTEAEEESRTPPGVEVLAPGEAEPRDDKARHEAEELAAYNRYLAELSASGKPKRW